MLNFLITWTNVRYACDHTYAFKEIDMHSISKFMMRHIPLWEESRALPAGGTGKSSSSIWRDIEEGINEIICLNYFSEKLLSIWACCNGVSLIWL